MPSRSAFQGGDLSLRDSSFGCLFKPGMQAAGSHLGPTSRFKWWGSARTQIRRCAGRRSDLNKCTPHAGLVLEVIRDLAGPILAKG